MLVGLSLLALVLTAAAAGMHAAKVSHSYNECKSDLVAQARGVLDRVAHDVRHADSVLVSDAGDAVNILVVKPGGMRLWRQYRREYDQNGGYVIKLYQDTKAIAFPPYHPDETASSEVLAEDVSTFQIHTSVTATRSVVETLYCRVTTCDPAPEGQYIIPFKKGPYVLKLSQTQFDEIGLQEGVDQPIDPRVRYEEDENPNTYWLGIEDCQSPSTYYEPWADWDFEDVLVKVTETPNSVDLEVYSGHGGYQWDILGPDGTVLWEDLAGAQQYSYTPYAIDAEAVRVQLELERDGATAGGTVTATQRRHIF